VDKQSMNYTIVVVGGVLFIAFLWWWFPYIGARHTFTGPRRLHEDESSKSTEPQQFHDDDAVPLDQYKKQNDKEEGQPMAG